ncbi:MAG: TIGR04149 family rSAM-modified RiPP [Bacteroidales bacterium]|nr:TIGR04149 family rSAM-modified RiPP [Bacteroidales bacterium]
MKKLGKIKLNQLSKDELIQREMSALRGGNCCCTCDCSCTCSCNELIANNLTSINADRNGNNNADICKINPSVSEYYSVAGYY